MAPAVVPTTTAAPIARGGAGRLPPTRSATTRVRKLLISSSSPHERELLRLRDDPEPEECFLVDRERPLELRALDDALLRLLEDPRRRLLEELEPERDRRDEEACFFCFRSCGCGGGEWFLFGVYSSVEEHAAV